MKKLRRLMMLRQAVREYFTKLLGYEGCHGGFRDSHCRKSSLHLA